MKGGNQSCGQQKTVERQESQNEEAGEATTEVENQEHQESVEIDHRDALSGNGTWQCEVCQVCCKIASHLRQSKECLQQLKSQSQLQFKGEENDEVFITKFTVIQGECPNHCCPTGHHTHVTLPLECLDWWKNEGWVRMGWRGDRENADDNIIKEKLRNFKNNHRRRKSQESPSESGTQVSQSTDDFVAFYLEESSEHCNSCGSTFDLLQHLNASCECRKAYVEMHLTEEEVDVRNSLFQLSIVLNICARVGCAERRKFFYLGVHLRKSVECLEFYQSEGVYLDLPNWNPDGSSAMISKRISQMKRAITEAKKKAQNLGCTSFRKELSQLFQYVCKCAAIGPDLGEDFALRGGWTDNDGVRAWFCPKCTEESPDFEEVKQKLTGDTKRLKGQKNSDESDLRVVRLSSSGRLVVAPRSLAESSPDVLQYAASLSTRIVVPSHPSAIRANMGWCDEVVKDKSDLKKCVHELLQRPIITEFLDTLSCLYRSHLADLREKMGRIYLGLSKVARGEVVSWNPNITSARKQAPNLEHTIEGAMQDVCRWSFPSKRQRAVESEARSHVNGQVKLHLRGTILMGIEDEELKRILLLGYRAFQNENATSVDELLDDPQLETFIIAMSPVILKYVRTKVKLFIKHIVAPNFSNHDLRLDFFDHKLGVEISGYIYAKQFDQVNRMLAADPTIRLLPDVTRRVTMEAEVLPTTTLDWEQVSAVYKFEELRAKDVVAVARRCQIGNVVFPLCLLNLWTPSGWTPTEEEKVLRHRVEELSHERDKDEDVKEAIINITNILLGEGLFEELVSENVDWDVKQGMKRSLTELCPDQPREAVNALLWYHLLLVRTGGEKQWTWKRNCGATLVVAYHPLLLEVLRQAVEVRVVMETECCKAEENRDNGLPDEQLMAGFAWEEISIMNFINCVSKENYEEPVSQATVNVLTSQEQELNFKDSDEKDEECDTIFVNSKDESFIISNGNLRKLYAMRPDVGGVKDMTFGQFIIDFYRKQSRQHAVIDPETWLGEDSEEQIVGGALKAPLAMKLCNNVIMKKRCEKRKPVPLLLGPLDSYGERLLFKPWKTPEELLERPTEEDKEKMKKNRLELFPMGIFPEGEGSSRRGDQLVSCLEGRDP